MISNISIELDYCNLPKYSSIVSMDIHYISGAKSFARLF